MFAGRREALCPFTLADLLWRDDASSRPNRRSAPTATRPPDTGAEAVKISGPTSLGPLAVSGSRRVAVSEAVREETPVFRLPAWVVVDDLVFRGKGLPDAVRTMQSAVFGRVLPMFTHEGHAGRFIESAGMPNRQPLRISEAAKLRLIVEAFSAAGVQYVAVDCDASSDPRGEAGAFRSIREIIALLEPGK
jgi:hypothetical protein